MGPLAASMSKSVCLAAASCSSDAYTFGGVGFGDLVTGKLGHPWVGAWVGLGGCGMS